MLRVPPRLLAPRIRTPTAVGPSRRSSSSHPARRSPPQLPPSAAACRLTRLRAPPLAPCPPHPPRSGHAMAVEPRRTPPIPVPSHGRLDAARRERGGERRCDG
ncbi:hypothetical protein C2845_PM14G06460 [Panicum miliaceum]|uniref:Uncharacterized protein n=1 Tax=Panicum miliaceum TaxID=4540 RepID=A0A3L6PSP3_PANMI|nr:hypothetical protein C2845_PM14G06460 [Panicum miliaceum]